MKHEITPSLQLVAEKIAEANESPVNHAELKDAVDWCERKGYLLVCDCGESHMRVTSDGKRAVVETVLESIAYLVPSMLGAESDSTSMEPDCDSSSSQRWPNFEPSDN